MRVKRLWPRRATGPEAQGNRDQAARPSDEDGARPVGRRRYILGKGSGRLYDFVAVLRRGRQSQPRPISAVPRSVIDVGSGTPVDDEREVISVSGFPLADA